MRLMGKRKEPHKRPTAEQMDERVKLPDDPSKVIEAVLKVDPNASAAGDDPEDVLDDRVDVPTDLPTAYRNQRKPKKG